MNNIQVGSLVKINQENSEYKGYFGVVSTMEPNLRAQVILFNKENLMVQFYRYHSIAYFLTEKMLSHFLTLLSEEELQKLNIPFESIKKEHFNFYITDSILKNNVVLLKQILEAGGDPNSSAYTGDSFLQLSVDFLNAEVFKILIEYEADINKSGIVFSILSKLSTKSVEKSDFEYEIYNRMFEFLLDNFHDEDKNININQSIIDMARYESRLEEPLLQRFNLLINKPSLPSKHYFAKAIKERNSFAVKKVLDQGMKADINLDENMTAFACSIYNFETKYRLQESFEILSLLVEAGANVNERDNKGTPLWFYLVKRKMLGNTGYRNGSINGEEGYEGLEKTIDLLIRNGLEIDSRDAEGKSILHWSAFESNGQVLEMLINKGFFVDAQDHKQYTPLMMAAKSLNSNKVEILIRRGQADIHMKNNIGHKALQVAISASWLSLNNSHGWHDRDARDNGEDKALLYKLLE